MREGKCTRCNALFVVAPDLNNVPSYCHVCMKALHEQVVRNTVMDFPAKVVHCQGHSEAENTKRGWGRRQRKGRRCQKGARK